MTTMALGLALLLAAPQGTRTSQGFSEEVRVGQPVTRGNLTVFPLKLRHAASAEDHLTLDDALAQKQLSIAETGTNGSVNALEVENRGDRPVVLVAGELLLGGKQDRIIGRSVVLAPRSRTQVPVFCVEHGRWNGAKSFESGRAMGHPELRKKALAGDQSSVWSEVARSNRRLNTPTSSDTYRAAARKLGNDAGPLAREIAAALARDPDVAGIGVAIGGEVVAVEWFASPHVFARIREKLVASYVAQALQTDGGAPAAPPTPAAVSGFAAKAERGEGVVDRVKTTAEGPAVHTSYLRK